MPDASRLSLAELLDQLKLKLDRYENSGEAAAFGPPWDGGVMQEHYTARTALCKAVIAALPLLLSELSRLQEARDSGALKTAEMYVDMADSLSIPEARRQVNSLRMLRALAGEP